MNTICLIFLFFKLKQASLSFILVSLFFSGFCSSLFQPHHARAYFPVSPCVFRLQNITETYQCTVDNVQLYCHERRKKITSDTGMIQCSGDVLRLKVILFSTIYRLFPYFCKDNIKSDLHLHIGFHEGD